MGGRDPLTGMDTSPDPGFGAYDNDGRFLGSFGTQQQASDVEKTHAAEKRQAGSYPGDFPLSRGSNGSDDDLNLIGRVLKVLLGGVFGVIGVFVVIFGIILAGIVIILIGHWLFYG
jgi:hypothetical protein